MMAADVVSQDDWFCWSLNQLAREFGIARETVTRRLTDAGVKPAGTKRGYPVYRVGDAASAILVPQTSAGGFINDPNKMAPKERRDWFGSENDRIKLEKETGVLVATSDTREQMSEIVKMGLQILETLPDVLERDFSLTPEIIDGVERKIDALRITWAEALEA